MEALIGASVVFVGVLIMFWLISKPYVAILRYISRNNPQSDIGKLANFFAKTQNISMKTRVIVALSFAIVITLLGSISIDV